MRSSPPGQGECTNNHDVVVIGFARFDDLTHALRYCISLTQALRLPKFLCASSARPEAKCWVEGSLRVPFWGWLKQAVVWIVLFGAKWCFEYYLVAPSLASQVGAAYTSRSEHS